MKENNKYITYLKALASILITNSHCRDIYPLFFLAVGGSHGNALFFIVSGFCLANIKLTMGPWLKKRYSRIVWPTLFMAILGIIMVEGRGIYTLNPLGDMIAMLINRYWFVYAIAIYYPIFYMIFCQQNDLMARVSIVFHGIIYFLIYVVLIDKTGFSVELEGFAPFKVYFYFAIFMVGGLLRLYYKDILVSIAKSRKKYVLGASVALIGSCICWAGVYAAIMIFDRLFILQCLIQISVYIFAISMFLLAVCFITEQNIKTFVPVVIDKTVEQIANSTLEIYLIQVTLKSLVVSFGFPVNWLLFFAIAFGGGILFHHLMERFYRVIKK